MSIRDNIKQISASLPSHVTLVAVSKTKPNEAIMEAYDAGQRDFGENYVQELSDKAEQLPKDIRWHFIGHLQSNKVKYIAPFVHLIHGVDSFKLLAEIDKQAQKNKRVISCLLQIYIAREESKFGFDMAECETLLASPEFLSFKNIRIAGMMGMASNTDNQTIVRTEFHALHEFYKRMQPIHDLSVLSMGMSSDYKLAIAEGSNMVRIGSSIFGERQYAPKTV